MKSIFSVFGHRRSIVAYPKIQVKYAALISALFALQGLCLIGIHYFDLYALRLSTELGNTERLSNVFYNSTLAYELIVVLAGTILVAVVMFGVSHRFLGPIIPLIRYFENIKNGDERPLLLSRDEDSLKPLIDYLKTVDIKVTNKN